MEKTDKAVVIPLDARCNDVGSWSALWDVTEKDALGNAISGDVLTVDTQNSYIYSEHKLVTVIGVENLVVVETKDAVIIASKARVQEVKQVVDHLKRLGRSEAHVHRKAYRPWGHYDSVDSGDRPKPSGSSSSPALNCHYKNTTTGPNTGWLSKAPRWLPGVMNKFC